MESILIVDDDVNLCTMLSEELTEIGYKHEVEADFGEQEEGVFQNVYIQKAKEDYKYGSFPFDQNFTEVGGNYNAAK